LYPNFFFFFFFSFSFSSSSSCSSSFFLIFSSSYSTFYFSFFFISSSSSSVFYFFLGWVVWYRNELTSMPPKSFFYTLHFPSLHKRNIWQYYATCVTKLPCDRGRILMEVYQQPAYVRGYPAKIICYKKWNLLYSDNCGDSGWVFSAVCNHDEMSNCQSMETVTDE